MTEGASPNSFPGTHLEERENWLLQTPSDLTMLVVTQDAPLLVRVHI